jgi:uncharacterized protein (DUF342 family)
MARQQINIRVDKERKARWMESAEESPQYNGLTHLIRLAVEKELSEDFGASGEVDAALDSESKDLVREISGSTERLEQGVTELKARLRQVEERIGESGPKFSFKAAVRESLPEADSMNPESGFTSTQTAARLGAEESEVREALESLKKEGEVQSLGGGSENKNYYFQQRGL